MHKIATYKTNSCQIFLKRNFDNSYMVDWEILKQSKLIHLQKIPELINDYDEIFYSDVGGIDGLTFENSTMIYNYLSKVL